MNATPNDIKHISIHRVRNAKELEQAQRLRYKVFFEEFGAIATDDVRALELDMDRYDDVADHLIVVYTHPSSGVETIIGTYRMIRRTQTAKAGQFNSGGWYDLSPLLDGGNQVLELSRSCVLPQYRTRPVLQLLWGGIADYIAEHSIDTLFGCASFHTMAVDDIAAPLSYLYHHHLSPRSLRPRAQDDFYVDMNILPKHDLNARAIFHDLPPLMKGYLRVGATIGDGAVIDPHFRTTDIFVMMQTHMITQRYRKHYERKIDKEIPGRSQFAQQATDILSESV